MTPTDDRELDALAAEPLDERDLLVLQRMAALYDRIDPLPVGLVDKVAFGITLDALHAEVAELQRSDDLVGTRADGATAQTITFTSASLTAMITVTPLSADLVRVDGWVAPGGGVGVELRTGDEVLTTTADPDGRFVFEEVPRDYARFVLRPPTGGAHPVVTPSIEL